MCIRDRSKKSAVSSSSLHNGASNPRTSSHGRSGEEPIKPKRAAPISKGECNCNARVVHETVQMTRMKVSVPFRNKDAKRFANQFVGEVTEHGLDAVTSEINSASLVNDCL